jgi:hypothetical protein
MAAADVVATVDVEETVTDIPEGYRLATDGYYHAPEDFENGVAELADETEEVTETTQTDESKETPAPVTHTAVSALMNQLKLLRLEVSKLQTENKDLKTRLGESGSSDEAKGEKTAKPKKGPTAYNLYVKEQTPIIKAEHPELKPNEIFTLIGANWRAMTGLTTPPRVKGPKTEKKAKASDAPKKKRDPSACNLFVKDELAKMKDVKMSQTEKFKLAMEKWKQSDGYKATQAKKAATA